MDRVAKKTTLDQYRRAYAIAKDLDIETRGSFIIGLPYDTWNSIRQTVAFSKELDLYEAFFNIATPYPGSVLWDMAREGKGLKLLTEDWSEYRRWGNSVIELEGLSKKALLRAIGVPWGLWVTASLGVS